MTALPLGLALPIIYLITIIFSTISQFFNPAEAAAIPLLVKPNQLTRANSFFQITLFATLFLGTSLLGPLLPDLIGPDKVFLVIGILYFICIWLVWALPKSEQVHKRPSDKTIWQTVKDIFHGVYEAWQFIRKDTQIWLAIVYLSTVQTALFTMTAIGIPFVGEKGLKQSSNSIIFVLAPLSIGLGIAVVLVNRFVTPTNRLTALKYACGALGIILALVGLVKPIADLWVLITAPGVPLGGPGLILLLVSLSIPFGFAIGLLNIPALTILQERSPKELVGRVFAAYFTFANAVSIIPILFAGALGDIFGAVLGEGNGIVPVFFIFGACIVLVAFYGHRRAKV
jgi:MFS family permease